MFDHISQFLHRNIKNGQNKIPEIGYKTIMDYGSYFEIYGCVIFWENDWDFLGNNSPKKNDFYIPKF